MSEFVSTSVSEVARLEEHIKVLQAQLNVHKAAAAKWEPQVSAVLAVDTMVARVSMSYGGSAFSVGMPSEKLMQLDVDTATAMYLEKFLSTIIADKIRPLIAAEVSALRVNATASTSAGNW